ncbi:6-phosphofructokinase [soil metagenome]
MNPAIHALTKLAQKADVEVMGIERGYAGLLEGEMRVLDDRAISGMGRRGGTMLGSSRCPVFMEESGQAAGLERLRDAEIEGLVVIGGDGSLHGAEALHGNGFPVIGLPGTIDNDLGGTDLGIGVDTALNTIITLVDMIKDTASSHERCFIVEVMGRRSGYLAAMATVSTNSHVAVIPEFKPDFERIVRVIQARFARKLRNTIIILAEGVYSAPELTERIVQAGQGIIANDIRSTVLGHVQRGGAPSHYDRLLATQLAQEALVALLDGDSGKMIGKVRGEIVRNDFDTVFRSRLDLRKKMIGIAKNLGVEFGDY